MYRDANSFVYADHKPTEDQIDRVIGKLNSECVFPLLSHLPRKHSLIRVFEGNLVVWIRDKRGVGREVMKIKVISLGLMRRTGCLIRNSRGITMRLRKRLGIISNEVSNLVARYFGQKGELMFFDGEGR